MLFCCCSFLISITLLLYVVACSPAESRKARAQDATRLLGAPLFFFLISITLLLYVVHRSARGCPEGSFGTPPGWFPLLNRLTLLKTLGFGVAYLQILSFANGNSRDPERKVSRDPKSPIFEPNLTLCTGFAPSSW